MYTYIFKVFNIFHNQQGAQLLDANMFDYLYI